MCQEELMRERDLQFIMVVFIACFLLLAIPVSAVKTAEQSVSDTLTRGSRFTVTITGLPNSPYYIWLPHTSFMTGEPRDQPPVIADSQSNVMEDPPEGPWSIGSYQYNNGNGQTIRDDVAASTPEMPNTVYYALVTTDSDGLAVVEFQTSVNTGLRSYSVRVENPRSVDSDNLRVDVQVFNRKAPAVIEIITAEQPVFSTTVPGTTESPPPLTVTSVITTVEPIQTAPPAQVPTQKAPLGIGTGILATGMSLLWMKRH
jgi:hypothetical protein